MIKPVVAVGIAFAAVFAQLLPSCDEQSRVVLGWVEDKYIEADFGRQYIIVVDRKPYDVPRPFYEDVRVGDKVRYDGRKWEIVQRAGEPSRLVPITILSPSPSPTPTPRPSPTP
ncbi:MAG: hypothetical protein QN163_07040 [Armatimonadota bacterium]|nr:hypothetical protein [Armatimonadota bacterium]MDR5696458.1 hypothetical protein [Armatimonadota bacterium]